MKKIAMLIAASLFVGTPAMAAAPDWWLVSGEPGAASVQFIDASSIRKQRGSVTIDVATYWGNGHNMERTLTMSCDQHIASSRHAELQTFACGSNETRMSTGVKLGSTKPGWLAKTVMSMPS